MLSLNLLVKKLNATDYNKIVSGLFVLFTLLYLFGKYVLAVVLIFKSLVTATE